MRRNIRHSCIDKRWPPPWANSLNCRPTSPLWSLRLWIHHRRPLLLTGDWWAFIVWQPARRRSTSVVDHFPERLFFGFSDRSVFFVPQHQKIVLLKITICCWYIRNRDRTQQINNRHDQRYQRGLRTVIIFV